MHSTGIYMYIYNVVAEYCVCTITLIMIMLYNVPQTQGLEQQERKLTLMDPGAAPSLAEESGPSPEYMDNYSIR